MYNVLLVDDEPWVLIGLQRIFNWENYNFHILCATSNSLEALEIIKRASVDVVLSDIRMPDLSGLDLLKITKENFPSITFILVSGFADFAYAQEACRQGAYDYLLKPIDHTQTDLFLEKLQHHIYEIKQKENLFHYELLQNGKEDFHSFFHTPKFQYYQVFHITSVKNIPQIFLPDYCEYQCIEISIHEKIFLCNTSKNLLQFLSNLNLPDINIGISELTEDCSENVVVQADIASKDLFLTGVPGIYMYHPTDSRFINFICSKIHEYHKNKYPASEILALFRNIPVQKINIEDAVYLWNQLCLYFPDILPKQDFYYTSSAQLIQEFKDWPSLLLTLQDFCEFNNPSTQNLQQNDLAAHILTFIHEHYTENLFLKDVADQFHLNCTYFSELFKKRVGMTFSKYLTKLRLEKAAGLLQNSSLTIEDICFQCGYNDYSYFNKAFKKHFLCTPYQYRKTGLPLTLDKGKNDEI